MQEILLKTIELAFILEMDELLYMHRDSHERMILTPKQEGVIEGCCNFMQYLKGEGQKVALAAGNPCSHFRESIEAPLGLAIPLTDGYTEEPVEEPLPQYETIINWKDTLA